MNASNRKLLLLGSTLFVVAICLVVAPFLTNYLLLMSRKSPPKSAYQEVLTYFDILVYGFMCFGSGSFDLMDNGLMGMMLGPERSRPFVQSLHAFAAVGFALSKYQNFVILNMFLQHILLTSVAVVMPHFLPRSADASEEICAQLANPDQNSTQDTQNTLIEGN